MVDSSQLTFLPSSKLRDTETRTNIKNLARSNLDIVSSLYYVTTRVRTRIQLPAPIVIDGGDSFWKWPDFQLSRAFSMTPPWIGSYCTPSCINHRPPPTCQISLKSKKHFVDGRTYARMYIRTDIWDRLYYLNGSSSSSRAGITTFRVWNKTDQQKPKAVARDRGEKRNETCGEVTYAKW